jgi:aspartate/tyrosine/aromatic aminotransferase
MTKDITITASLQKELNLLKDRVGKLEIQIKNNKKEKKIKDPNAPIKNISNYLHFSKEFRPKIVKENPEIKSKDIIKKLAEEWNKIKEDPKKKKKMMILLLKIRKDMIKNLMNTKKYKIINKNKYK